ncbi:MAG: hypothetical protein LWY06_14165, partial [Firmicutes bacterium]|nr:hypothetical protein [Bacillota bacterium]
MKIRFTALITIAFLLTVFKCAYSYTDSYSADGISCKIKGGIITAIRKGYISVKLIQPEAN